MDKALLMDLYSMSEAIKTTEPHAIHLVVDEGTSSPGQDVA